MLWLVACSETFVSPLAEAPADVVDPPDETLAAVTVPALRLNEVQAVNDSTVMDAAYAFPDWVELYNAGDVAIALADVTLTDGELGWTGGAGTIAPGGRLLLWADGGDGADHLPFALDADGEHLELAVGGVVSDRLATGEMRGDTAWARYPDGGAWAFTARPTPDATNGSDPGRSIDPTDQMFPADRLLHFDLTLPESSMASLGYDPYGEVEGSLAWGPAWFPKVGVRLKGVYGSLRTLAGKAAFKIDLNAFADHRLRGLETLTFNNMVQDPSYVHETLAYAFFRSLGLPAPRTAWMRLTVNGEDWGLYLHVESVDDTFLARWWADPTGRLYEGAYGVDFTPGEEDSFEYDEGPEIEDRSDLYAVSAILDGEPTDAALAELETHVDMDQILQELAVEALLLHWDGYTTANNYRVYDDPDTGRFQMIPWGTDQTFHDERYGPYDGYGELLVFCLQNAGCSARYDAALLDVADAFEGADLATELDADEAFLVDEIATDVRGEQSADTIAAWIESTRAEIIAGPDRVRAAVTAH
jgi:hypothetical protein